MGGRPYSEGKMPGRTSHRRNDEPVAAGTCIGIHRAGDNAPLVLGRLVSESRHSVGQRQVVIYGFRHMDIGDGIVLFFEKFRYPIGCRSRIVAADGHEQPDVVIDEKTEVEPFGKVLVAGPVTAHVEVRPAAGENLVGQAVVYVQHFGFSGKEPFVTVVKPYHTVSVSQKGLRDAADNGIHARCRATPGKYGYGIFHCTAYLLQVRSI